EHEVVNQFVIQLIELPPRRFAPRLAFGVHRVQPRLDVERLNQRIRVEEQLQNRQQQLAQPLDRRAVRLEQRRILEREVRQLRRLVRRLCLAELIEQVRAYPARIEELLELHRRQLADL